MQARTRLLLLLIPFLISLVYSASRIVSFVHLFFEHAGIAITQAEIRNTFLRYSTTGGVDPRREWIPRHIHQVWHDWSGGNASSEVVPQDWEEVRRTCKALMPDWEYTVCCVAYPGRGVGGCEVGRGGGTGRDCEVMRLLTGS
jgi:inositol phosphorylceramide mannosyltransferase catalytic subunit